ncbi:MAG: hypothetical protein IJ139_02120 [Bacteroidaceae bacterium]|jgi:hypothetical protein|nr:hypothetical protein [Bacteroidaceae bacterium]MBQ8674729.1 hypothetical protein [Bacteroidaceae bacterium]MBQ9175646.1 hypothetical protein [Bacteroidaceae bacterium]
MNIKKQYIRPATYTETLALTSMIALSLGDYPIMPVKDPTEEIPAEESFVPERDLEWEEM